MTEDASLDDFFDAGSEASADEASGAADDSSAAGAEDAVDADAEEAPDAEGPSSADADQPPVADSLASGADPDPASAISSVSPDGAACESCGATVVRRWADDGAAVCADCKEW